MYSLLLSELCNGRKESLGSTQHTLVLSRRKASYESAAAAVGSAQLPGEEEAGAADMVLSNDEAEICCFVLGTSSPAQVCFLPWKHFWGNLRSRESSVFRPELGFESTANLCVSEGAPTLRDLSPHSLTCAIYLLYLSQNFFSFQNICSVLVMQCGICKLSKGGAPNLCSLKKWKTCFHWNYSELAKKDYWTEVLQRSDVYKPESFRFWTQCVDFNLNQYEKLSSIYSCRKAIFSKVCEGTTQCSTHRGVSYNIGEAVLESYGADPENKNLIWWARCLLPIINILFFLGCCSVAFSLKSILFVVYIVWGCWLSETHWSVQQQWTRNSSSGSLWDNSGQ